MTTPRCIGCKKVPEQIHEYTYLAKQCNVTPTQFVIAEEGTYNMFKPNKFYCTPCYIAAGQPIGRR